MAEAVARGSIRLAAVAGLWWVLATQEWIPSLVTGVVVVPLLGGMLVAGGLVTAYNSTRFTKSVKKTGLALMGISASFAVGALIGLSILNGSQNACAGRAECLLVMWWAILAGVWTVLAGIWGMTRDGDSKWADYQREVAARLVVGTTVVAAVLLAVFGLMFSGAI